MVCVIVQMVCVHTHIIVQKVHICTVTTEFLYNMNSKHTHALLLIIEIPKNVGNVFSCDVNQIFLIIFDCVGP